MFLIITVLIILVGLFYKHINKQKQIEPFKDLKLFDFQNIIEPKPMKPYGASEHSKEFLDWAKREKEWEKKNEAFRERQLIIHNEFLDNIKKANNIIGTRYVGSLASKYGEKNGYVTNDMMPFDADIEIENISDLKKILKKTIRAKGFIKLDRCLFKTTDINKHTNTNVIYWARVNTNERFNYVQEKLLENNIPFTTDELC